MVNCSVDECARLARAKGLCLLHYGRQYYRAHHQLTRHRNKNTICLVDGCTKFARSKGACQFHYYRKYMTGSYELVEKLPKPKKVVVKEPKRLKTAPVTQSKLKLGVTINRKPILDRATDHIAITNKTWSSMKSRCSNTNRDDYARYGGRGITVCDRWLGEDGFLNFVQDMGLRPGYGFSIDRKDVNGNYEPSNCRWATAKEQSANRRPTIQMVDNFSSNHYDALGSSESFKQKVR